MDEQAPMPAPDVPTPAPAPVSPPMPVTPPPTGGQKPASSMRWVWMTLFAVVVLAGCAYGWVTLYPATPVAEVTPSPSASVAATVEPTAGWKTYTNVKYGFEFKYPTEWGISEHSANGFSQIFAIPKEYFETDRIAGISISVMSQRQMADNYPEVTAVAKVGASIDGHMNLRIRVKSVVRPRLATSQLEANTLFFPGS